jgi:hypothetical protein
MTETCPVCGIEVLKALMLGHLVGHKHQVEELLKERFPAVKEPRTA